MNYFDYMTYHDFGAFTPITTAIGILLWTGLIVFIIDEYNRTGILTLSQVICYICMVIGCFTPIINAAILIVLVVKFILIDLLIGILTNADKIILCKKHNRENSNDY